MNFLKRLWRKINEIPRPKYQYKTAQDLADKFKSDTYGLGWWIQNHIWYKKDEKPADEFRSARETLMRGYGDCDDFARLSYEVLKCMGIDAVLLTLYPVRGAGHAICQFKGLDGQDYYYDNGEMLEACEEWEKTCERCAVKHGFNLSKWYRVGIIGDPICGGGDG